MIHKINEPKFEPEMHDSRSQTGKRPPPLPVPIESQQPLQQPHHQPSHQQIHNQKQQKQSAKFVDQTHGAFASLNSSFNSSPSVPPPPSYFQPYSQSPLPSALPINPFINNQPRTTAAVVDSSGRLHSTMEEKPAYHVAAETSAKMLSLTAENTSR